MAGFLTFSKCLWSFVITIFFFLEENLNYITVLKITNYFQTQLITRDSLCAQLFFDNLFMRN